MHNPMTVQILQRTFYSRCNVISPDNSSILRCEPTGVHL